MQKNKKYFIVSDTHSFFTILKKALDKAGFDINNDNHIIIFNGDIFDRGDETLEIYNFIMSIPKKRRILIKGNHEELYLTLLNKDYPERHDFSNRTVKTFCAIAEMEELSEYDRYFWPDCMAENIWNKIVKKVKKHKITKWLQSKEWLNYYELDNYIITHCFIPLKIKESSETKWCQNWPIYRVEANLLEPILDWRVNTTTEEWNDARWGCPYKYFDAGLFKDEIKNNKILVCGHWHTSDFHVRYENNVFDDNNNIIIDQDKNFTIYKGKNLIAIDGCTAYSHSANVLVIENGKYTCYNSGAEIIC